MSKSISPVHPFALGPGGSRFELLVATFYLTSMLKGELPFGFEKGGLIFSVKLQQRNKGNPVDDIVIKAEKGTLSVQVKHSIRFTNRKPRPNGKPPEFYDALSQCWDLYNRKTFNKDTDCFGIAIDAANLLGKNRNDIFDTITWAKNEISVVAYLQQLEKFKAKKKYFEIFQDLLADISKGPVHDEITWDFIRHLIILPFDFHQTSGYSGNELRNKLLDLVKHRSVDNAMALCSRIYDLATTYAITGGEFDSYSLEKQLPSNIYVPINNTLTSYVLQKNLAFQLKQKITREKNSKKYIPRIFTETPHAKDELRLFSDPVLLTQKIVEDLQKIDIYLYNEITWKLDFPQINIVLPDNFQIPNTLQEVIVASDALKRYVSKLKTDLKDMDPEKGAKVSQHINYSNRSLFEEIKYLLWGCNHSIQHRLENVERHLDILSSQILIVEGKAASGKTNFICNFADTTLNSRQQTSFYATGYDLSIEATTSLKGYLVNRFNDEYDGKLAPFLKDVERISLKDNKPLLIIIDGINEHSDLAHFARQLEQLIEDFTSDIHVRFILTCRSEYFEKRFVNLRNASFKDKTTFIEDLTHNLAPIHRKFMLNAYFRYFRINCHPSREVVDRFVGDPLILRLFCEAYEPEEKSETVTIEPLNNIILDILFEQYNLRITKRFEEKYPESGFTRKYKKLLYELANYMLMESSFSNVPVESIPNELHDIVNMLVNEGVMLRKDLADKTSIIEDSEVINFTYDEFRDYILANFLIYTIAPSNFEKFKEIYSKSISPDSPVAEGLEKYTFILSRKNKNHAILGFLESIDNYADIFLNGIFLVDNSLISEKDLELIRTLFQKDSHHAQQIYSRVRNRRSKKDFPLLNIWLFLDLVAQFDKNDYIRLINPIFSPRYGRLENTCTSIESILEGCTADTIERDNNLSLLELLLCLSPVPPVYSQSITPFELFLRIADDHPKPAISLIKKYLREKESYVSQKLWAEIAFSSSKFKVKEIYDIAIQLQNELLIKDNPELSEALRIFLSRCTELTLVEAD
ncbi:hypothetical protein L21_1874 [Methanoculleus chikugoensis]|uniref:Uncharacterized protein n=1 Tax=Methanoculleus chikugoensis TaxID=118126 RepID=A0A1M4MM14_9EURY|nr:hypothetical protein [Methanoculleus chikugoensis]SCL75955.1 hypothetical protein L21_1874 [Methanoculleus chikugoensis]